MWYAQTVNSVSSISVYIKAIMRSYQPPLTKKYFIFAMHLLLWMNAMLDFICFGLCRALWNGNEAKNSKENVCINRNTSFSNLAP